MSDPKKLTPATLAALLCARICHDLISPVSALGAALEVFDDDDNADMKEDAMDLIRVSSRQAADKLQFLRLAFGAGGSAPGVIGTQELRNLTEGMYGEGKASLRWKLQTDGLPKAPARLLLNLTMLAVQAIPRGGDLTIEATDQGGMSRLTLTAEGPKARLADAVVATLSGKAPDDGWDGRTVQPFYTGMIAREAKGRVEARIDGDRVVFTALIPSES
ncbi:histidine phosphotransferase ChpT [Robiginitomaculum antarcticum]|uniref:histidine phosphotransferase ChpT n=1 Tax=Robiginitomaculum antarcticum TaxID=437507 RepID=UPI000525C421|nr:histidine phosphotransferase family protein [Robiginitomaculum antarcticum]